MALTANQIERFEDNQRMRDEIFELVRYDIADYSDYLKLVDDYDHSGTPDDYLERESVHLKNILLKGGINESQTV